jgi:DNA topoisomerase-2
METTMTTDMTTVATATAATTAAEDDKKYSEGDWNSFILTEPDTFIGSIIRKDQEVWLLNPRSNGRTPFRKKVQTPMGMTHLYVEVLSNASDAIQRSLQKGQSVGSIEVYLSRRRVRVRNACGDVISIMKNARGVYNPTSLFGRLLSSTNYGEKNKLTIGKNGLGVKLTNLFSKEFTVRVYNHLQERYFEQTWLDNMQPQEPMVRENYVDSSLKEGCGFVEVEYELDFGRFGYTDGYDDETMQLFAMLAALKPVMQHGVAVPLTLIYDDSIAQEEPLTIQYTDHGLIALETMVFGGSENIAEQSKIHCANDEMEVIIYDTPDCGTVLSAVNGQPTWRGGTHVDAAVKEILATAISFLEIGDVKLSMANLMEHVTVFVSARLRDPKFDSQTKSLCEGPKPSLFIWPSECIERVKEWDAFQTLAGIAEAKRRTVNNKNIHRTKRVNVKDLDDANDAGTKESLNCTLILVEGKSARQYATASLSSLPGRRNRYGVYPLRGKLLNILRAKLARKDKNDQFTAIRKALGLKVGVDYTVFENCKRDLRYGSVMIETDQDGDGQHISALIMLMLALDFPTFLFRDCVNLENGSLCGWLTPYTRGWRDGGSHRRRKRTAKTPRIKFFSPHEYDRWLAKVGPQEASHWTFKYFKGLGTSAKADVKEDCENPYIVKYIFDKEAMERLHLAFSKDRTADRKQWILDYVNKVARFGEKNFLYDDGGVVDENDNNGYINNNAVVDYETDHDGDDNDDNENDDDDENGEQTTTVTTVKKQQHQRQEKQRVVVEKNISRFIDLDLMRYNLLSIMRQIPDVRDGLVVAERKIIWTVLQEVKEDSELKVAQLGAFAATKTAYHHNEVVLGEIIAQMAQSFVGTNNMPYLEAQSLMGNRYDPRPAEPRYTFVKPAWWLRKVFRKEDDVVLTRCVDEGVEVEPHHLAPIIPMQLINGCRGLATGNATFIPWYNPLEILNEMRKKLMCTGEPPKILAPWCRGFKGTIELLVKREDEIQYDVNKKSKKRTLQVLEQQHEQPIVIASSLADTTTTETNVETNVESTATETETETETETVTETTSTETLEPPAKKQRVRKVHARREASVYRRSADEKMEIVGFVCYGKYRPVRYKNALVTELPIGTSGIKYREILDSWQDEKMITEYHNHCGGREGQDQNADDDFLCFNVIGLDEPSYEELDLVRRFPLTNMVMLRPVEEGMPGIGDVNVLPQKYRDTNDVLDDFIYRRLQMYQRRKTHIIQTKTDELSKLLRRRAFISDVVNGRLVIINRPEQEILREMAVLGHDNDMINTSSRAYSRERIESLSLEIENIETFLEGYRKRRLEEIYLEELTEFEEAYKKHYRTEAKVMKSRKIVVKKDFDAPAGELIDVTDRGDYENNEDKCEAD